MNFRCGALSTKFSSDVPVYAIVDNVSPVALQCGQFQLSFPVVLPYTLQVFTGVTQWYPSVHWVSQWHFSGIPVYTGPANVHSSSKGFFLQCQKVVVKFNV